VDTQGDSFFVAFPTALDALAAAAEATRALAATSWQEATPLRVRMGLHTGAPQLVGDRYIGLDVHRAARMAAAGHGGQILLSAAAAELARRDLPDGVDFRDLGIHRLKDLQQAEQIYQAVLSDLPADFPSLKTLDARPHNLPIQPTPLIGREADIARLCGLLRQGDVRLVTLTGPGGVGKTRLGLQLAAELVDDFADGVYFVRLSRLSDPRLVIPTIAQILGLRETASLPIGEVLREYVRSRSLLILVDNFEQVSQAATDLAALLEASPGLKVLVTSRGRLHLRGEKEAPIIPLALPVDVATRAQVFTMEELTQSPAVALFLQRAQDVRPDFALTSANAVAVAAICARLDGLPLAIELAAARIKLLPPAALLKRLERSLPLLTGGARDLDERQQTMRNTLAWSYELLAPPEQRLFRRLAVFAGGWTLEAAEAVCLAPASMEPLGIDVLEGLSHLVDHSLVQQHEEGDNEGSEARFVMLHIIGEFAHEQLEASGETAAVRQTHLAYYLVLAEEMAPEIRGPHPRRFMERLDREYDNVRAALRWAQAAAKSGAGVLLEGRTEAEVARLYDQLGELLHVLGRYDEARDCWRQALNLAGPDQVARAELACKVGNAWRDQYRYTDANRTYNEALDLLQTIEAPDKRAWLCRAQIQFEQIQMYYWLGQPEAMLRLLDDIVPIVRQYGSQADQTRVGLARVNAALRRDRYCPGPDVVEQTRLNLKAQEEAGQTHALPAARFQLGFVLFLSNDLAEAEAQLRAALELAERTTDPTLVARCLTYLTFLARRRGEIPQVQKCAERSLRTAMSVHMPDYIGVAYAHLAWVAWRSRDLDAVQEQGAAALSAWRGLPVGYMLEWAARWPLIGAALLTGDVPQIIAHAHALLDDHQQREPHALEAALSAALRIGPHGTQSEMRAVFDSVDTQAQDLGYW
jgi:predicted ATPase